MGRKVVIVNLNRFNSNDLFVIKCKNINLEPSNLKIGIRLVLLIK